MQFRDCIVASVAVTIIATAGAVLAWRLNRHGGLVETVSTGAGGYARVLAVRRTAAIDLGILDEDPALPRRLFSVRWTGAWRVPTSAFYGVTLEADDHAVVSVDGEIVQEASVEHPAQNPRVVWLSAGFHGLDVTYTQVDGAAVLRLSAARAGQVPHPLDAGELFAAMPAHPRLEAALEHIRTVLSALAVAGVVILLYLVVWRAASAAVRALAQSVMRPAVLRAARVAAMALATLVVLYGAFLRFDALTLTYGPVTRPAWLSTMQRWDAGHGALRPDSFHWTPVTGRYISDPYTYLQYAREMRSFYAAHRREPMFPFVTKIFLELLGDQDVAVSFASASFSVLAIIATYLLGAYAFSFWVGLGAALCMAIEHEVIAWGVGGWRDDAFTCAVVLSAWAMLRYWRAPSLWNAALLGAIGGSACLIRITSLSFLIPGFVYLGLTVRHPIKERAVQLGTGLLMMAAIAGPFILNCWLVFGDPLYSINVHSDVYREAEGQRVETRQSAGRYLFAKVRERPAESLDTAILGMTRYPFVNKWSGFDPWSPAMGRILSIAALAGLLLFVWSAAGRLLLLVLATSLVPYAMTWRLISDWRFTEHAYPFFLIAASLAIRGAASLTVPSRVPRMLDGFPRRTGLATAALVLCGIAAAVWIVMRVLPVLTVLESLRANDDVTIMAGARDGPFFREGWSQPLVEGNVTERVSQGLYSVIRIPLPRVDDYDVTVRIDPFPRPLWGRAPTLRAVRIFLNGQSISALNIQWTPDRVGAYNVHFPKSAVKAGGNWLALTAATRSDSGFVAGMNHPGAAAPSDPRFRLWYVRIHPPQH